MEDKWLQHHLWLLRQYLVQGECGTRSFFFRLLLHMILQETFQKSSLVLDSKYPAFKALGLGYLNSADCLKMTTHQMLL